MFYSLLLNNLLILTFYFFFSVSLYWLLTMENEDLSSYLLYSCPPLLFTLPILSSSQYSYTITYIVMVIWIESVPKCVICHALITFAFLEIIFGVPIGNNHHFKIIYLVSYYFCFVLFFMYIIIYSQTFPQRTSV